ncbi:MAG: iron-containing alcohol dehydrogenase [Nevskiales bacterium]
MILFALEVLFLRIYMIIFKFVTWLLPFREPELFDGPGSSLKLCAAIAKTGHKKVLLVTDGMLRKIGLLDGIEAELKKQGVDYVIYDGVEPNPTIDQVETGLKMLKDNGCTAVMAVGGGSSMDAAKIIAARAAGNPALLARFISFFLHGPSKASSNPPIAKMAGLFLVFWRPLPMFVVPTTAGTGSEVTIAAVISDPANTRKFAIIDLKLVPQLAALDPELMKGLPPAITSATGMDALTHAVEAFVSNNALRRTDEKALEATRLIMKYLPTAVKDGNNLEARQNMALASYLAGWAFTQAGVGYVHAIAHNFGAYYHTPHGLANAIVMPHVLDYSKDNCIPRLAKLAMAGGLKTGNESEAELAGKFIARIRTMNQEFGIPDRLQALKATDIPAIATAALSEARFTYAVPRYMDKKTCENLIRQMLVTA